ncbi:MAG: response regulator [Gemmatimonadetes bacterium]|nr:response regulator [Gemmatimonadota bacterium]
MNGPNKQERIQRALYHILDATTRSRTLDELLLRIHEQVQTVMQASNFFVTMYDPSSDRYSFLYHVDEYDTVTLNSPVDLSGGFTDLVRKRGEPILGHREDVQELLEAKTVRILGKEAESWLGMPFRAGDDVGVVVVQSYARGTRYTASDEDALKVICGQIGLAIERKRSADETAKRQQLLDRILDNVSMGFAINHTVTGQVLYVNDAFPRAYRISRADCANMGAFFKAVYGRHPELGQRILADVQSGDPARMAWEDIEMVGTDGETFYVSASNIPLPEQQLMISTVLDVTAQKRLRDKQAELESRLQMTARLESVGVLAGGIAHDFNNLLTAILGNLNLAADEADAAERSVYLEHAARACLDATHLTHQLLTFAKGGEPVLRVAHIANLVRETVDFSLSGSNVKADVHVEEGLSAVEVDEGQLKQVLHNLVLNAQQAMPEGGRITVRASNASRSDPASGAQERTVRIAVRDTGPGIAAADLSRIFEPFFTTKKKGHGTGLGLATAYSIIRRHNGTLSVTSAPGHGAEFVIELPASTAAPAATMEPKGMAVAGANRRILVMDDEPEIRHIVVRILKSSGFDAVAVADGAAALELYEEALRSQQPFAAVILDLTIPGGLGGRATVAGLKALDANVRAIVSSGYSDTHEASSYQEQGFVASLQKPYTRDDLIGTVARVVGE